MMMVMADWTDLSDDELLARLARVVPGSTTNGTAIWLAELVRNRDDDDTAATISHLLEA